MTTTKQGLLSHYFVGVAVKKLSAVEADTARSNQHEFNGVKELKTVFGPEQPRKFDARFIWLGDEQEAVSEEGFVTWYDARAEHPTRSEYRLYFPTTPVSELANTGDVIFIARRADDTVLVVITPLASTIQNQLVWLFGIDKQLGFEFDALRFEGKADAEIGFAATFILDELGIEAEEPHDDELALLVARFELKFPTTRELSRLARDSLAGTIGMDDPDAALLAWMDREERLFRRLERNIVAERLTSGFAADNNVDVDGFIAFSLSVQNRRKARAGLALENHLEAIFLDRGLRFSRNAETENHNKPDFLFPGQEEYHDTAFPAQMLTLLGAKSTLKDRWRQVLSEADRIKVKHLLTVQPGISENQTEEMRARDLQLVVPTALHDTYGIRQRAWLLSLADFIQIVEERQHSP